jgi:hypothetical protein
MSKADPLTPAPAKKRGSRRRWLLVAALVLLPVLLLAGIYICVGYLAELELQDALAEADRLDPGWRLNDLSDRPEYADDDNSALPVLRARALLPYGWGAMQEFNSDAFNDLYGFSPRPQQLDPEQQRVLRKEMAKAPAAVAEARKLADMPHGHFPDECIQDWIWSRIITCHCQDARAVAYLLQSDTLQLAQEGDADGALRSTRAIVNTGRSVGDEPTPDLALLRIICRQLAAGSLQRVLTQGEPSPAALVDLQRLLEEEVTVNPLLCYARGKRAGMDHRIVNVQNGNTKMADLLSSLNLSVGLHDPAAVEVALITYSAGGLKSQRAAILRSMTRLVESAKVPPDEQTERNKQLEAEARNHGLLVRALVPAEINVAKSNQRSLALLRSAIVALAVERYRRAHDDWPASLDALVAKGLLQRVPTDPYDGAPLRSRLHDNCIVIYSVAQDLQDNGGTFDNKAGFTKGTDIGFTLWNVSQRRLLPLPAAEPLEP